MARLLSLRRLLSIGCGWIVRVCDGGKVEKLIDVDKTSLTAIAFSKANDKLAITYGAANVHWYSWPALEADDKTKVSAGRKTSRWTAGRCCG